MTGRSHLTSHNQARAIRKVGASLLQQFFCHCIRIYNKKFKTENFEVDIIAYWIP